MYKTFDTYADRLNEAQKRALYHRNGPAMILAGPGSGKTTVLIGRVRYLTEGLYIEPASILVLTYTKTAALSMQRRFFEETAERQTSVVFGTFHAVCYQILKEQYYLNQSSLLSEQEKIQIIKSLLKKQKLRADTEEAEQLIKFISMHKNTIGIPVKKPEKAECDNGADKARFALLYHDYALWCEEHRKLDFDDMLIKCFEMLRLNPVVRKHWQKRFSYILVDEFQDCNNLQFSILKLLAGENANLFVVGDDDQSIYGFRGANPSIMQEFVQEYPDAVKIYLEANYRSKPEIIKASNAVIKENVKRFPKTMYGAENKIKSNAESVTIQAFLDKKTEEDYIVQRIKTITEQIALDETAVIFRTNREAAHLALRMEKEGIPYFLKGKRKNRYAHFTVRDISAYLQAAETVNKREGMARGIFLKIMNKPERNIEREYLLQERIHLQTLAKQYEEIGKAQDRQETYTKQKEACLKLYGQLCRIAEMSPWSAISYVRKMAGYDKWLLQKAGGDIERYEEWKGILDAVQGKAKEFGKIEEWLAFVTAAVESTEEQDEGGIRLLTMHAAKGLEFSYVCIPDVNEGNIPSMAGNAYRSADRDRIEEERRLFYVGMTRAKTALDILYVTGTKESPKLPSRFLNPLC